MRGKWENILKAAHTPPPHPLLQMLHFYSGYIYIVS